MISQQDIIEISSRLVGSMKLLSAELDLPFCDLLMYYEGKKEMSLSLYLKIQEMIENGMDENIESLINTEYTDFLTMKRIRKNLNLSLSDMADILGLTGDNAAEVVKLMENGCMPIKGPVARIVKNLSQPSKMQNQTFSSDYLIFQNSNHAKLKFNETLILSQIFPRFIARTVHRSHRNSMKSSVELGDSEFLEFDSWVDIPRDIDEQRLNKHLHLAVIYLRKNHYEEKVSI